VLESSASAELYPLTFQPIFQERVWGGRKLETVFGRRLPAGRAVGESWELADRPGAESVIARGALAGRTLRWVMARHGDAVLGGAAARAGRFPLLVKLLDAAETLSVQVHPKRGATLPAHAEPKAEFWYVADAAPGAFIFAGLRAGTTRARFERALADGTVETVLHRIAVRTGDTFFLPSGRVHALGAGVIVFEVQENSDDTYRLHDWGRVGADGRPRELHLATGLEALDFADVEPGLCDAGREETAGDGLEIRRWVNAAEFRVCGVRAQARAVRRIELGRALVVGVTRGRVRIEARRGAAGAGVIEIERGGFCLLPAVLEEVAVMAVSDAEWIESEPGVRG
jgi:mannose-6-phosphate isomerase